MLGGHIIQQAVRDSRRLRGALAIPDANRSQSSAAQTKTQTTSSLTVLLNSNAAEGVLGK
jgi:hypothetical protein